MQILQLILLVCLAAPATAQQLEKSASPMPGVEFTKIQDLDPNAPATNRPIKQKWALVVGVSKFRESRLNPVEVNDLDMSAREFSNYLTDQEAGRFDPSHVKLLTNSNATRQNILSSLGTSWLGKCAGTDDLVVVYIATSAFPTTDGNTYLCSYDCALDNIYGTCISMQNLMETMRKSIKCSRIVLVLQAAYSGAAELESGAKALFSGFNIDLDKVILGTGYIILSSSKPNEITWGSSFSRNLISALKKENGLIDITRAFLQAKQQTEQETAKINPNKKQTPVLKSSWSGNPLVIGAPPVEKVTELPAEALALKSAEANYLKATQLFTAGKLEEALAQYKSTIEINPRYADALADYGAALAITGNWQAAADSLKKALETSPDDALFHYNYARVLEKLGKGEECDRELQLAYNLNPKDSSILVAISSRALRINNADEASKFLLEAISLYPSKADLHERLSYAYAKAGRIEESYAEALEATRLAPNSVSARLNLGTALMIKGDLNSAIKSYRDAERLSPHNAEVHLLLSKALERRGDKENAIYELKQFIGLVPNSDPRTVAAKKHIQELAAK